MWLPGDEAPETREGHTISSEKLMVMIAWNSDGFHVITVISKKQKFHIDYYCTSVLAKLSKIARQLRNETRGQLICHADKARPHIAKSTIEFWAKLDLRLVHHHPDSSDLALSDFLFLSRPLSHMPEMKIAKKTVLA
jgi:hypothetical protein